MSTLHVEQLARQHTSELTNELSSKLAATRAAARARRAAVIAERTSAGAGQPSRRMRREAGWALVSIGLKIAESASR